MDCTEEDIKKYLESNDFPPLKNTRIIDAAKGIIPDKLPVWIMRQAGRYLPEFQAIRKKHTFFEICKSPKLACEVTLMPIRRYDFDAAIIFSDILVVPQALGLQVVFEKKGPIIVNPLTLDTLNDLDWSGAASKLTYVGDALKLTRHKLEGKVPLIGFSAAPWTLMVYMIEGGGTKTASQAKKWLYLTPDKAEILLEGLKNVIIEYIVMQISNGAQLIQLFESSAEYLNTEVYERMIFPKVVAIRAGVLAELEKRKIPAVPMIFFAKGGGHFMDVQLKSDFEVLGVDWITDPKLIRQANPNVTLQGNLDPCALYSKKEDLCGYVDKMFSDFGYKNYIVNLGHGIYPDMSTDAVQWFIDAVHAKKPQ